MLRTFGRATIKCHRFRGLSETPVDSCQTADRLPRIRSELQSLEVRLLRLLDLPGEDIRLRQRVQLTKLPLIRENDSNTVVRQGH
jgi:hypothetical protein